MDFEHLYARKLTQNILNHEIKGVETFQQFHHEFIETLPEGRSLDFKQVYSILSVNLGVQELSLKFAISGQKNILLNEVSTIRARFYIEDLFDE